MTIDLTPGKLARFAYNADNYDLRGKPVSIVRIRPAMLGDISRVVVRIVLNDGSLGQEYQVRQGALIAI